MKYITALLSFLSSIASVYAVYISEIMYDPQGSDTSREWVEIYNDTNNAIDFTSWKLFESGTNHGIVSYSGGTTVQAGGYAVIADNPVKFLTDFPNYQGVLYDSSFSLSNSGEQLILKDGTGSTIDTFTYVPSVGGNDDGSTLSKIEGTWTRGIATPGAINQVSGVAMSSSASSTENQVTIAQLSPPSPDIIFYLPFERTVVAGADTEFSTYATNKSGKVLDNLTCTWAFGDGGKGVGTTTTYRYAYPGRYIAQVEGTTGYVAGTGRIMIHVVPPDLVISKIDTGKYGMYVDIFNPNTYTLDLSQWKLVINGASFPFPKNTLILGNTTTRFSGVAMGFASTTLISGNPVQILFPNFEEVARYIFLPHSDTVYAASSTPVRQLEKVLIKNNAVKREVSTTTQSIHMQKDTRVVSFLKTLFKK